MRGMNQPRLTKRQREVLYGIAQGELRKQTAHRLGIATGTVKNHARDILCRLEAETPAHAVYRYYVEGLGQ